MGPKGLSMCEHLLTLSVTLNFLILSQTAPVLAFPGWENRPVVNCPSVTGMGTLAIYTTEILNTSQLVHLVLNQINHDGFHHWGNTDHAGFPLTDRVTHICNTFLRDSSMVTLIVYDL